MEIRQYLKDKNNKKVGIILATADDEKVKIGFSKCNTKHDKFDKNRAIDIARIRAENYSDKLYDKYYVPFMVNEVMPEFIDRCMRYYKDKVMPNWIHLFVNYD